MITSGPHTPYGRRHVVPLTVSVAKVYVSPVMPALTS